MMNSFHRNVTQVVFGIVCLAFLASSGVTEAMGLEGLTQRELENILRNAEYEEDYGTSGDYFGQDPEQIPSEYFPDYQEEQSYPVLTQRFDDAIQALEHEAHSDVPRAQHQPRMETQSHGTPVSHFGTTKANVPKNGGAVLPAYCDPPNPCPVGYTAKDGCIENFENTSEFSRTYQSQQNCLCDSEHMFNCPLEQEQTNPQMQAMNEVFLNPFANKAALGFEAGNPFLAGEKLSIAAKKGLGF